MHGDARRGAGVVVHGDQRAAARVPRGRAHAPGVHGDRESPRGERLGSEGHSGTAAWSFGPMNLCRYATGTNLPFAISRRRVTSSARVTDSGTVDRTASSTSSVFICVFLCSD